MIVFALDAGRHIGWALVNVARNGTFNAIRFGETETPAQAVAAFAMAQVDFASDGIDQAVVETVEGSSWGQNSKAKSAALIETAKVGQRLVCALEDRHVSIVETTANEVRQALGVKRSRTATKDAMVKANLAQRCVGTLPVTNNHVRDAMAAGVFGALKAMAERKAS